MNAELKALIAVLLDLFKVGESVVLKHDFVSVILPSLYKIASDIPNVISNMGDLNAEIKALPGSAQEADLIAYIVAQFAGVDSDAKAQAILQASLKLASDLVADGFGLAEAIKG